MPFYQLYYTSCRHPHSGQTGFQVKAQTPDIPTNVLRQLQPLMGYRIPPELSDSPLEGHPSALRYRLLDEEHAVLLCSQSNGSDELGRPGNYFSHVVVGAPQDFPLVPIEYWRSPFWLMRDDSDETILPLSEQFAAKSTFDFGQVWDFIGQGNRRAWLRALLGAVIEGRRKIVLVDEPDAVALWIYAVTLALPPELRMRLSFATYHHDTLNAPFMLIGASKHTQAQSGQFVLDAYTVQISEAAYSPYAEFVGDYFEADLYEREVKPFFEWLAGRGGIAQLDEWMSFYLATRKGSLARDWARVLAGAKGVVEVAAPKSYLEHGELQDVRTAAVYLGDALLNEQGEGWLQQTLMAWETLHRLDRRFPESGGDFVERLIMAIGRDKEATVQALQERWRPLYAPDLYAQLVNERLPLLVGHLQHVGHLLTAWQVFGGVLQLRSTGSQHPLWAFFAASFAALDGQVGTESLHVPDDAKRLISQMLSVAGEQRDVLLQQAAAYKHEQLPSRAFDWLYMAVVERLPIEQRAQHYWPLYWGQFEGLLRYELQHDLLKTHEAEGVIALLDAWLPHLQGKWQYDVLHEALGFSWERVNQQRFATFLLGRESVTAIVEARWYEKLVESSLAQAKIGVPDAQTAAMYRKFSEEITTNPIYLGVMQGSLALFDGEIAPRSIGNLRKRFESLSAEQYRQELGALFEVFFKPDHHRLLLQVGYIADKREAFWTLYWERMGSLLIKQQAITDTLALLDTWFHRQEELERLPYLVPEFFVGVVEALKGIREGRGYKQVEREFESHISQMAWYAVVEGAFKKVRKGLLGGLLGN